MKNLSKIAFVAASALTIASSAFAGNGDLIVGFTSTGGNDFIQDLGLASGLHANETWNVGANLGSVFGVVGYVNSGSHIFSSSSDSAQGGWDFSQAPSSYATIRADISTLSGGSTQLTAGQSRTPSATDSTGWYQETDLPPGGTATSFQNDWGVNPNASTSAKAYLFDNTASGAAADGYFVYDSASGILTYDPTVAVPEPATYGIIAGFGLLIVSMRRQFAKA